MSFPEPGADMRRREFLGLIGSAAAWPGVACAQQARLPHVGVLMGSLDHGEARLRLSAFTETFEQLGWIDGQNVRVDIRWAETSRSSSRHKLENWYVLSLTLFLLGPPMRCSRCRSKRTPFLSCLRASPTRSDRASSIAWRGQTVTSQASALLNRR